MRWISKRALLPLHDESLAQHGGASGIGDGGLLESALARWFVVATIAVEPLPLRKANSIEQAAHTRITASP